MNDTNSHKVQGETEVKASDLSNGLVSARVDPLADDSTVLLQGSLADAWPASPAPQSLRRRLVERARESACAGAAMVNRRRRDRHLLERTHERSVYQLYEHEAGSGPLRAGEPVRVRLAEIAPQGVWMTAPTGPGVARDWLIVQGAATLQTEGEPSQVLSALDHVAQGLPASAMPACVCAGADGAVVLLREHGASQEDAPSVTSKDSPDAWEQYAPMIRRRVLWRDGPMAAMLWSADPGASVPHHTHGHDEECLMLRGDLFQDDYLLREGDYQLAPSGSAHRTVETDTGALIYAHGDLDMRVVGT